MYRNTNNVSTPLAADASGVAPLPPRLAAAEDEDLKDRYWSAPEPARAQRYADRHHPRAKRSGGRFPLYSTTTGRHCPKNVIAMGCDPFAEGIRSEFGVFGAGISNYFKFLKWGSWVRAALPHHMQMADLPHYMQMFFLVFIMSCPEIVINSMGAATEFTSTGISVLAETTVGNLGDSVNSSIIPVPSWTGCNGNTSTWLITDCALNTDNLGKVNSLNTADRRLTLHCFPLKVRCTVTLRSQSLCFCSWAGSTCAISRTLKRSRYSTSCIRLLPS
jgi:hypothetical protein